MHYSWRNPCSNLPQPHPGSKVQCHNLHQNIAVAPLDQGMLVPSPWHLSSPEAGKHTLNNQFHYRKHISKARASEIFIFVNRVLDLFKHRSNLSTDQKQCVTNTEPCHPGHHISGQVFCCRHSLAIAWNQTSGEYRARLIPLTFRKISEPAWSAQV